MQKLELKPHQAKAVDQLHPGCILAGGVGVGKTVTALAYYDRHHKPKDLLVITTAKKRDSLDWEKEALHFGIGTRRDATLSGVLKVDSWNNIDKYEDVEDAFIIYDEQRLVGSGSWTKSFIKISKSNEWILLSATPGDTWLDYIPVFIANGFYRNRTEFKRRHVVYNTFARFPKVDHYVEVGTLVRQRNAILVEMPYERHTTRITEYIDVDYDKKLFERVVKDRWHVYENRPLKDVSELFIVMRKVVNSDSSRLRAVSTLLETHPKLIVFYNFDYELEMLRELASSTTTTLPEFKTISDSSFSSPGNMESSNKFKKQTQKSLNGRCTIPSDESSEQTSTTSSSMDRPSEPTTMQKHVSAACPDSSSRTSDESWEASKCPRNGTPVREPIPKLVSTESSEQYMPEITNISSSVAAATQLSINPGLIPDLNSMKPTSTTTSGSTTVPDLNDGTSLHPMELSNPTSSEWQISDESSKKIQSVGTQKPTSRPSSSSTLETNSELNTPNIWPSGKSGSSTISSVEESLSTVIPEKDPKSFAVAEWNGHKHQPIPETDSWVYLVQYTAGSEGWNCVETDAMCFFSLTYSYKAFHQSHGRIDRLNTPFRELHYYVLKSKALIDVAIFRALSDKKNFNENQFSEKV